MACLIRDPGHRATPLREPAVVPAQAVADTMGGTRDPRLQCLLENKLRPAAHYSKSSECVPARTKMMALPSSL